MTLNLMRSQIHGRHMTRVMNSRTGRTLDVYLMCLVAIAVWDSLSDEWWKRAKGRYIGLGWHMQTKWIQISDI